MVRPVVVGTAGDRHGQPIGAVIGEDEKVGARLRARIGARSVQGRLLREEEVGPVEGQVAVHFVRGDLVIALDAVLAAGIHKRRRAEDVGLQEDAGVLDGAVHMAFGRKVDNDIGVLLLKEAVNALSVADVELDEAEVWLVHDPRERRKIARIGEFIEADDAVAGMLLQHMENEVAADEPRPARDDDGHFVSSFISDKIY